MLHPATMLQRDCEFKVHRAFPGSVEWLLGQGFPPEMNIAELISLLSLIVSLANFKWSVSYYHISSGPLYSVPYIGVKWLVPL